MNWVREVAIWVTGLAASATAGGGISYAIAHDGAAGIFGGLMAFTCLRLWINVPRPPKP